MASDLSFNVYDVVKEAEKYFETIDKSKKGSGWKSCLLYTSDAADE